MYKAPDYDAGVKMACDLIMYGGAGHTSVLYTNPLNHAHIQQYQNAVKTVRIHPDQHPRLAGAQWAGAPMRRGARGLA